MEITIILIIVFILFYFSSHKERKRFDEVIKNRPDDFPTPRESTPIFGNPFMSAEDKLKHMQGEYWANLKALKIEFTQHRCELCFSPHYLHLHHLTYQRLGCERIDDVVLLCYKCHQLQHDHYGYDRLTIYKPLIKPKLVNPKILQD